MVVAIRGNSLRNWLLILLGAAAAGAFVFYGPSVIVDWALILLTGSRLPQLVRTWFNRATAKATAVSVPSLLVALTSMCFWMAFAVLTENHLIVMTTTVAITITLLTALVELNIARRAAMAS